MTAISIQNVDVRYGDVPAVVGVSIEVTPGELHVLLGHSGSGKTTLLRAVAGFERVTTGRISLDGTVVDGDAWVPPERRRVGLVFQDYALFPHLTVGQNVGFAASARNAEGWLARVGLSGYAGRAASSLSGGEQQRVALARALASQPAVVLLDEPFSNLDRGLRQELRDATVDVLRAEGTSAIFVTHDAVEALSVADCVSVLHGGHLLQTGSPADVYERPRSREVALCVGDACFLPATLDGGRVVCALGGAPHRSGHGELAVIRPEAVTLDPEGVEAGVIRQSYLGASTLATLDVAGHTVRALLPEPLRDGRTQVSVRGPLALVAASGPQTRDPDSAQGRSSLRHNDT